MLFLAQVQAAANKGVGMINIWAMVACVAVIALGGIMVAFDRNLHTIAYILVGVGVTSAAIVIVNWMFQGIGGANQVLQATGVN